MIEELGCFCVDGDICLSVKRAEPIHGVPGWETSGPEDIPEIVELLKKGVEVPHPTIITSRQQQVGWSGAREWIEGIALNLRKGGVREIFTKSFPMPGRL